MMAYPCEDWRRDRRRTAIRLAAGLPLLLSAVPATAQPAATNAGGQGEGSVVTVLLDQAHYWQSKSQPTQAQTALERLLRLDPGNAQALALLAQMQAAQGEQSAAETTLGQLRQQRPNSVELGRTERSVRIGVVDPTALAAARSLAQQGQASDAATAYQVIFHGTEPPENLAVEYYQVLAATPSGWQAARDGLGRHLQVDPQNSRGQLALAELLTYREPTRADGIGRLQALAADPATAVAATRDWRQALQWLAPTQASLPAYAAYLALHPDDSVINARLAQARTPSAMPLDPGANSRGGGYAALAANRLDEADQSFTTAIQRDGNDADALGGLGLVQLRRGHAAQARLLLAHAIAADPTHRERWEQALAGADAGADYARAQAAIAGGRLDEAARTLDAIIRRGGNTIGAHAMRAGVAVRQGRPDEAEADYRAVLRARPGDSGALIGLAGVLQRQNRTAEVEELLAQAEASGHGTAAGRAAVGRLRGLSLRQQAGNATDPATRLSLLHAAVEADPEDPWTALELARALKAAGEPDQAAATMAVLTRSPRPGLDALRAGVIFASEAGHDAEAAQLIGRLPPSARTPQIMAIGERIAFAAQVRSVLTGGGGRKGRNALLALAAQRDPDGSRGSVIAKALMRMGNRAGVSAALSTALAATPQPTVDQRLAYAGLLMQAGQSDASQRMIAGLDDASLTPDQRSALNGLRAGVAVQNADALNNRQRPADAYDSLAPALRRDPENADLNLALGRLYMSSSSPRQALEIDQAVLQRDPDNLPARRSAVEAAIQLHELDLARTLSNEAMTNTQDEPGSWIIAALYERSVGNDARALQDLRMARSLRQQQIGASDADAPDADAVEPDGATRQVDAAQANPFRSTGFWQGGGEDSGLILPTRPADFDQPALSADTMSADIDTQIAVLQDALSPKAQISTGLRDRSGDAGTSRLQEVTVPVEAEFSPGRGRLTGVVTPTFLDGGRLDDTTSSLMQFGSNALGDPVMARKQTASGVALDANWKYRWLTVDAGSSPVGFRESNVTGGVELAPALSSVLRLRVVGERRAVTDSVLSYAGTEDTRTGRSWGGVARTHGHAQLELAVGRASFYAGGGYSSLDGTNVESNKEFEFGAGGSYPFYRTQTAEARIGLDLVYFGYDHNLNYYSYGQGGYFSPSSYFAMLIPLDYHDKTADLSWNVGGSAGYQRYHEQASNVFPNDPSMQAQLVSLSADSTTIVAQHPGSKSSGIVGSGHAGFEYNIAPQLALGGKAVYERAGDWNQAQGLAYLRYSFEGAQR